MGQAFKGSVFLFFAFTLAGTSVIAARFVQGSLGTFTITAVSLAFSLVFLMLVRFRTIIRTVRGMMFRDFILLSVQALFGIFLFRMFLLKGLTMTSAGEAGILTSAAPAITAVLAILFLREKADAVKLLGIACTLAGILLLQGIGSNQNSFSSGHFMGNLLVIGAAACESLFNIFSRAFTAKSKSGRPDLDPFSQTAVVSLLALFYCLFPAVSEKPFQRLAVLDITGWLALVWYGVFVTALAFVCWYQGIRRCGALTASAFSGMMPFTSVILSVTLLGETMDLTKIAGGLTVIGGMALIGLGGYKKKKPALKQQKLGIMAKSNSPRPVE